MKERNEKEKNGKEKGRHRAKQRGRKREKNRRAASDTFKECSFCTWLREDIIIISAAKEGDIVVTTDHVEVVIFRGVQGRQDRACDQLARESNEQIPGKLRRKFWCVQCET